MISILNPSYQLPHIYATGYSKTFTSGANAPILASGINKYTGVKGDFVIKLKASETMKDPSANLKELLAAFIAMELDIPVAMPVKVDVTQDFIETIHDKTSKLLAQDSIGLNFGSWYVDGYATILLTPLQEKLIPYAQSVFAFDLLIQNIDRTNVKPNMLTNGEEIVVIDHEKAFSFINVLFVSVNIWELNDTQKDWIRNHILHNLIKGKAFDFELFMDKCNKLTEDFWKKAWELTPDEWKTEQFATIKDKLNSFINNRKEFIKELQIIMS